MGGCAAVKAGLQRGCNDPKRKLALGTTNHLYSVAAITNTAGQVVERYSYNAYGVRTVKNPAGVVIAKSVVGNDRGFTSYKLDAETGLYAARARMFSAKLGRFISHDKWMSNPIDHKIFSDVSVERKLDREWATVEMTSVSKKIQFLAELGRQANWDANHCIGWGPRAKDGYIDGFHLYAAFFVPNTIDPLGLACGSGAGDAYIPDRPFGFDFTPCCEAHDNCYDTCGAKKADCDNAFYQCMMNVANTGSTALGRWWGRRLAGIYYQAVNQFGSSAYNAAQDGACNCWTHQAASDL